MVRSSIEGDTALILAFIRELAKYEKMEGQVVAQEDVLRVLS